MHPTDPKPLDACFQEGMEARLEGRTLHDNPYAAGSAKRREWQAGYCATVEAEDEDGLEPDPGEDSGRRGPG